jgi:hypothetical protein
MKEVLNGTKYSTSQTLILMINKKNEKKETS